MYAVIKTGGKQYRVQVGDVLDIEKLDVEEGREVTFAEVLLIEDNDRTLIGNPVLDKAQVVGEVIENFKDKKIIVFKKKRRKQFRRMKGHRQLLTRVRIEKIVPEGVVPPEVKPTEKKLEPKKEPKMPVAEVKKKKPAAKEEKPEIEKAEKKVKKAVSRQAKPKASKAAVSAKKTKGKKLPAKKVSAEKKRMTSKKEK